MSYNKNRCRKSSLQIDQPKTFESSEKYLYRNFRNINQNPIDLKTRTNVDIREPLELEYKSVAVDEMESQMDIDNDQLSNSINLQNLENHHRDPNDEKINKTTTPKIEICLLILSFIIRFSLSEVAQKALLQLIRHIAPSELDLPKSIERLYKECNFIPDIIHKQQYCVHCNLSLENKKCGNRNCSEFGLEARKTSTFSYVSIKSKLKMLIENNILEIQNYYKNHIYTDLVDSEYYSTICNQNNLNLMIYTDEIALDNSSRYGFWPVIISLVELPYKTRESNCGKILCGIWMGQEKPTSENLFSCLIDEVKNNQLIIENIRLDTQTVNITIGFYGFIADSPAKSRCLSMTQYNGEHGCPYCNNPGFFDVRFRKLIYLNADYNRRNHMEFVRKSVGCSKSKRNDGFYGTTVLTEILNLPNSLPIDYMHLICLGLFKTMFTKWFNSSNSQFGFYIGKSKIAIQNEIRKCFIPKLIKRTDFDLSHCSTWKATEYKNFFFYLALPCLKKYLGSSYYWNLVCFIYAVREIHRVKSEESIHYAKELLEIFISDFIKLYGEDTQTFTLHLIAKHLIDDVRLHGSLVGHSMFSLESTMGYYKSKLHGTRGFDNQYIKNVTKHFFIRQVISSQLQRNKNMSSTLRLVSNLLDIDSGIQESCLLNPITTRSLTKFELDFFGNDVFFSKICVYESQKLKQKNNIYYSSRNFSEKKTSTIIHYITGDSIGQVTDKIQKFRSLGYFDKYFHVLRKSDCIEINPLEALLNPCIEYPCGNDSFIVCDIEIELEHD